MAFLLLDDSDFFWGGACFFYCFVFVGESSSIVLGTMIIGNQRERRK